MLITMIACTIALTLFLPQRYLFSILERCKSLVRRKGLIARGEDLLVWLDQISLNSVGFDLDRHLPQKDIYKHYGEMIFNQWNFVRTFGGSLGQSLKSLKYALRQDLKYEKEKRSMMNGAYVQIAFMLLLSWSYTVSYYYLELARPSWLLVGPIAAWQLFGLIVYFCFIRRWERRNFAGLIALFKFFSEGSLFMQGSIPLNQFRAPTFDMHLGVEEEVLAKKVDHFVMMARDRGHFNKDLFTELEDDLRFLLKKKIDLLLSIINRSSFMWSILFILPSIFVTTFFSVAQLFAQGAT